MLAAKRSFVVDGKTFATPMLIPSFSSRGFRDVRGLINRYRDYLDDYTLVSAYDLHHSRISQRSLSFANLIFVDSGGYEKGGSGDLSEVSRGEHTSKKWAPHMHGAVLKKWDFSSTHTIVVTYDNPSSKKKLSLEEQVDRAKRLASKFPDACIDFLIKPGPGLMDKTLKHYLNTDYIVDAMSELEEFEVIGVTEGELGRSIIDRMHAISRMRQRLTELGRSTPIHIFGSLDPISSSLYFISGADIFDGLTWLRYGYWKGSAMYRHNAAVHRDLIDSSEERLTTRLAFQNLGEIDRLKLQLETFCAKFDFSEFEENCDLVRKAEALLDSRMKEA